MRLVLTLITGLMLTGCPNNVVIRDSKAYRLEAIYFKKTVAEQQVSLKTRLKQQCCENGVFSSAHECARDGETYAVTNARFGHHYARLMYLAGYEDNDPGDAPKVETVSILEEICREK